MIAKLHNFKKLFLYFLYYLEQILSQVLPRQHDRQLLSYYGNQKKLINKSNV